MRCFIGRMQAYNGQVAHQGMIDGLVKEGKYLWQAFQGGNNVGNNNNNNSQGQGRVTLRVFSFPPPGPCTTSLHLSFSLGLSLRQFLLSV